MKRFILVLSVAFSTCICSFAGESVREERINIRKGNDVYEDKNYAEAEVTYRKALEANPDSKVAAFNLATALTRQSGGAEVDKQKGSPMSEATEILKGLASSTELAEDNPEMLADVHYDLGNIAYNQENYGESIKEYKNALRINPADEDARRNLRLAQLKIQQQEQEKKEDKKDKEEQDKQEQEQEQKQEEQKQQEQQQNQDQQPPQQNQEQQQQQQQPQQGSMSKDNVDQILKTMQNQEKDTQQKVNAQKMKQQERARRTINNQW